MNASVVPLVRRRKSGDAAVIARAGNPSTPRYADCEATSRRGSMSEFVASYLVWFGAVAFAAASAFTLITMLDHFDPPDTKPEIRKAA
jgi:hypothetical protein